MCQVLEQDIQMMKCQKDLQPRLGGPLLSLVASTLLLLVVIPIKSLLI